MTVCNSSSWLEAHSCRACRSQQAPSHVLPACRKTTFIKNLFAAFAQDPELRVNDVPGQHGPTAKLLPSVKLTWGSCLQRLTSIASLKLVWVHISKLARPAQQLVCCASTQLAATCIGETQPAGPSTNTLPMCSSSAPAHVWSPGSPAKLQAAVPVGNQRPAVCRPHQQGHLCQRPRPPADRDSGEGRGHDDLIPLQSAGHSR